MAMLWDKLSQDIVTAMKAKDELALLVLRMAKASMTNTAIEKKKDRLDDAEVLEVLARQMKQRKESFDSFTQAGRAELAQKEQAEMAILARYLPAQLSTAELEGLVKAAIQESGAKVKADLGRVMAVLMPKVKGKADGKAVNQLIQSLLA